ncbi:MAG: (2Fe-2S)-binding protein [Sphaerochaetaceae bacterium]|nr:(2Fe-2S)-binding protein [Sphaerochaetaceae bacterium]
MKVCRCAYINYESILESVKKYGDDLEAIQEETEAGTICEMCMFDECSKVDISLPDAIKKALDEV